MIESVSYLSLSNQPVYEWDDVSDDLWAAATIDTERRVWESIWWLGDYWLFEAICEHILDDDWEYMIARNVDDVLEKAISRMIAAHNPWDSVETCDKCGREFQSLPREDHPEGILWCSDCAAKEMDEATDR